MEGEERPDWLWREEAESQPKVPVGSLRLSSRTYLWKVWAGFSGLRPLRARICPAVLLLVLVLGGARHQGLDWTTDLKVPE